MFEVVQTLRMRGVGRQLQRFTWPDNSFWTVTAIQPALVSACSGSMCSAESNARAACLFQLHVVPCYVATCNMQQSLLAAGPGQEAWLSVGGAHLERCVVCLVCCALLGCSCKSGKWMVVVHRCAAAGAARKDTRLLEARVAVEGRRRERREVKSEAEGGM